MKYFKYLKPVINLFLPTLLFYAVYGWGGILAALLVSMAGSVLALFWTRHREGKFSNTQVLGLVSGVISVIAIVCGKDSRLLFLPSLVQNVVLLLFFIVLSLQKKSVLHYLVKDFPIKTFEKVPEEKLLLLNLVWILFFVLKILSKAAGMLWLDFELTYWLVFLLGDPAMVVMVLLSAVIIKNART